MWLLKHVSLMSSVGDTMNNYGLYSFIAWQILEFEITSVSVTLPMCKGKERKGKWTCIAPIVSTLTTKRSDVDHTELPAYTPHLPFLRISIC